MLAKDLKKKYLDFFVKKGHKILPNASLVPENDPSVLFTTAGMHPLVPFLLGEPHPLGKKLCSLQRVLRTDDIDNVGDGFHHTFFEMLGNWSLGDYWKKEAISLSYEFLTKVLKLDPDKLSVSCFAGDKDAPKDEESAAIWKKLGIPSGRIYFLQKKDNWWGPAGKTGPCGPDSEMFIDTGKPKCGPKCDVSCQCGKYIEIWNDVFMQYNKTASGKFEPLKQKNVDTGMGVERVTAITSGFGEDDYKTELFWPIIQKIEEISSKRYKGNEKTFRIIADHVRAVTFLIAEGIPTESNNRYGSVARRLIDRALDEGRKLGIDKFLPQLSLVIISNYKDRYSMLDKKASEIINIISLVESRVEEILATPSREAPPEKIDNLPNMSDNEILIEMRKPHQKLFGSQIEEYIKKNSFVSLPSVYAGTLAFEAKTTEGRPVSSVEMDTRDSLSDNFNVGEFYKSFNDYLEQHKKISREAGEKLFKGGLMDHSETVVRYHTATHLIHAALRKVLGDQVHQVGSNLTAERLRFDFTHPEKLTEKQLKQVADLINQKISQNLPVKMEMMSLEEAKKKGALAFFAEKYGEKVKVYSIGPSTSSGRPFSVEICGGPHVSSTGEIGKIEIFKEESCGSGKRRIYARVMLN